MAVLPVPPPMSAWKSPTLTVHEIYHSVQGESTWAGLPCVFVRLTFCNLRCTWCDTEYAFHEGEKMGLEEIVERVESFDCPLVEVTGGEPLLQPAATELLRRLCDAGFDVLLETGGSLDISQVDPRVHRIMDLKAPGSGEVGSNLMSNLDHLTSRDELKFVLADREDYDWMKSILEDHPPPEECPVLVSPVFGKIDPREIVGWILEDGLPVRFQLQMHKFIWDPETKGV